jgi:hypothetical protein
MKLRCIICLLAMLSVGPRLGAQVPTTAQKHITDLQAKLAAVQTENKTLRELVTGFTAISDQNNAALAAQKRDLAKIKKDNLKATANYQARELEYKLTVAENKMLRARIKSLLKPGALSTTKPKRPRNVRYIAIELHEQLWKWWIDPQLLTEHIALRRKLVHLDVDHSIDAWLARRKEFAGTTVNWEMKLVSGRIISREMVDKALKEAKQDLDNTLKAAVYGKPRSRKPNNSKIVDRRIGARATSRPALKKRRRIKQTNPYERRPPHVDYKKQIRHLQEQIELYTLSSASGGMTTIYAIAGNIAVKMPIPGRHFAKLSLKNRPTVQLKGEIISATPKAGYFAGRKDRMIQFVVIGECKLKNPVKDSDQ